MARLVWFTKHASLTAKRWWLLRRSYKIKGSRSGYSILVSLFSYDPNSKKFLNVERLLLVFDVTAVAEHCLLLRFSVLQNRELQIMRKLDHCNIVRLRYFFYSSGEKVQAFFLFLGFSICCCV